MARPKGSQKKDRPFRDALRMELAAAGGDLKRLRKIASALIDLAESGQLMAIKEVADRLDGKPPQAVVGDDAQPIEHVFRWKSGLSSSTRSTTSPDPSSSPFTSAASDSLASSPTAAPEKP
jgi:hypothetical protein